ncbi:MAG: DEAD/DEAH box helicase [Myxococcales bacterium]|nr:DEAD/DEAH box helicase [Myxococcales bacterium]
MAGFLAAVRAASLPGTWSTGVRLVREGAVTFGARSPTEATARVRAKERPVAPTVTLYLEENEWSCDCDAKVDPCAHVAAAAIALEQGGAVEAVAQVPEDVAAAPPKASTTHVGYRFARRDATLLFGRVLVGSGGGESRLEGTLASRVLTDRSLLATHDDMAIDRMAQGFPRGIVPLAKLDKLLELLESSSDVRLDASPVRTSGEPVLPRVVVTDGKDGGVTVRVERPRGVDEVVAFGVVRTGDRLRPIGERELSGERLEKLPSVRAFSAHELGTLAAEVLPALEGRIDVVVRTKRVPGRSASRTRPRLAFELSQGFFSLSVLPTIVYGDPPVARVDGETLVHLGGDVPVRDVAREKKLAADLREKLSLVVGRRVDFEGRESLAFAARLKAFSSGVDDPEGLLGKSVLVPKVVVSGDKVHVAFETDDEREGGESGHREADVGAVLRAHADGFSMVPLVGGGFAELPSGWLSKHGSLLADILAARRDDGTVAKIGVPALARLCESLDYPPPPGLEALRPLVEGFSSLPPPDLPDDLTAELRPYQLEGVAWLGFLQKAGLGGILADDMGLGKTLQTLAAVRGRTLVVCPTSVLFNWSAEIGKFRPGLRVGTYHGPKRALDPRADVTLTSYGTLRSDLAALSEVAWDAVVLDEAQAIKNPDSQTARAAYAVPSAFRLALSGTPVENRLEELYSLSHFANPGLLGGLADFRTRFAEPVATGDATATAKLRERIRPFFLRRKKSDVARDLPPRTDDVHYVELDETERATYDAVRAATRKDLVERMGAGLSVMEALEALLRLRQAACHAALLPGRTAASSSKVDRLVAELGTLAASRNRALVFSQWTSLLDLVEPRLREEGISFTRLDGGTKDREAVVRAFQAEDGPDVLLLSLKAGGVGLNLTAADHVFLVDPWWNPAVEEQAADRAHRIGQDKPVFVHRLVVRDTVEERMLELKEKKRALAEAAVGDGGAAVGLTRDDLLALLA